MVRAGAPPAAHRPTDSAGVRDAILEAIDHKAGVRVVGRGTWLEAGRPVDDVRHVALNALTGVVDYTPGDLTLTARAGTTLAEIGPRRPRTASGWRSLRGAAMLAR